MEAMLDAVRLLKKHGMVLDEKGFRFLLDNGIYIEDPTDEPLSSSFEQSLVEEDRLTIG